MSSYRIVTRAFPADYWVDHGEEILDTANELHDERWSARESRSLLAHGLRTRSLQATGGSPTQMWIQCAAFALTWWVLLGTATVAADLLGLLPGDVQTVNSPWFVLVGTALVILLCRSTRWAPLAPSLHVVQTLEFGESLGRTPGSYLIVVTALSIWVAWKGDGRPMLSLRATAVLALVHIAGLTVGVFSLGLLPLVALPLGLLLMSLEPRVLGVAAIEVLFIFSTVVASIDNTPQGELAVAFGVVTTALVAAVMLASLGNRRLRRTI